MTSVLEVLERLEQLLLLTRSCDNNNTTEEKKSGDNENHVANNNNNDDDELMEVLQTLEDWSHNEYRRQELCRGDYREKTAMVLTAALRQVSSSSSRSKMAVPLLHIMNHLAANSKAQRQALYQAGAVTIITDLLIDQDRNSQTDNKTAVAIATKAWTCLGHLALLKECAEAIVLQTPVMTRALAPTSRPAPKVLREVIGTLANIAGHTTCHGFVIANTTLEPFCQIMQLYSKDAAIQHAACQVWWNILATVDPRCNLKKKQDMPAALQAWQSHQGLERVLAALVDCQNDDNVVETACGVLSCVVWTKDDNDRRASIVQQVMSVAALQNNPASRVWQTACRAVANLCREHTAAQATVLQNLAPLTAVTDRATQGHADDALLALAALDAWSALAVGAKYAACTTLVQAHVAEQTIACLQAYPDQAAVADAACLVLWAVAQHYGKYVAATLGEDGEAAIAQAIETHGDQVRYGSRLQGRLQWKQRWGRR